MKTNVIFVILVIHCYSVSAVTLPFPLGPQGCEYQGELFAPGDSIPGLFSRDGDRCSGATCTETGRGQYMMINWESPDCPTERPKANKP